MCVRRMGCNERDSLHPQLGRHASALNDHLDMEDIVPDYDVIVVGAGHAGMMTATYLARTGLDVLIMEKGLEVGGDMNTESFTHPGYWHNLHSYYHLGVDRLAPFRDLEFERFHARYATPDPQNALLLEDGRTIIGYLDPKRTADSVGEISGIDAEAVRGVNRRLRKFLREQVVPALYGPQNHGNGGDGSICSILHNLGDTVETDEIREYERLTAQEAAERLFKDPAVQAFYLNQLPVTRGLRTDVPGLGHVILLAVAQAETAMLLVDGGPHVMAHALWRAMLAAKGNVKTVCDYRKIIVEDGRAVGVELADGTCLGARKCVVGALGLEEIFLDLVGRENLPPGLADGISGFHSSNFAVLSVHLAIRGSISFRGRNAELEQTFKVDLGPQTPEGWADLWSAVDGGRPPDPLCLSASIPTAYDSLHAPDGGSTAVLWAPVPYRIGDQGVDGWDDVKDAFRDACMARFNEVADLSQATILDAEIISPADIDRGVGNLDKGAIHMGEIIYRRDAYFSSVPDLASYRTPIEGLYYCGSCTHPGGGVIGATAYHTVNVIADDLGIEKWWAL